MRNQPNGNFGTWKPVIIGGLVAFILLTITLALLADPKKAEDGQFFLSFIFVPVAGGLGGLIYSFLNKLNFENQQLSIFTNFFSVLLYLFLVIMAFTIGMESLG